MSHGVLFALNWGFSAWALGALGAGLLIGWLVRGVWETGEDAMAARRAFQGEVTTALGKLKPKPGMPEADPNVAVSSLERYIGRLPGENAVMDRSGLEPVIQDTRLTNAFHTRGGDPLPTRAAWGELPYEELAPMFLDQFLLRYFAGLMPSSVVFPTTNVVRYSSARPWDSFVSECGWAEEMPLLFEQLTGYKLNDRQLNEAIGEYISRLEKSQRAATPGQRETQTAG